jgi:ABC-type uncharacterized transport system substrate-binding protein
MRAMRLGCLLLLALCGPLRAAGAHPHAWIDVKMTLVLADQGKIAALRQDWSFDQFYSSALIQNLDGSWNSAQQFAETAMRNLEEYRYFTEATRGGAVLAFGTPQESKGDIRAGRLTISFLLPFAQPVDAFATPIELRVFDPTYYVEMANDQDHPVATDGTGASCAALVADSSPSPQDRELANRMDADAPADPALGRLFAQTVTVSCQKAPP